MSKLATTSAESVCPDQTAASSVLKQKKSSLSWKIFFIVLVLMSGGLVLLFSVAVPVKVTTCSLNLKDGMKEEAISYFGFIPGTIVRTPTEYTNFTDGTDKTLLLSVTKKMLFEERFHEVNTAYMLATLEGLWQNTFFDYKPELLQQKAAIASAFNQNNYAAVNRIINSIRSKHLPPE